jgi:RimJ/RimL family protein N-acetyltransferase
MAILGHVATVTGRWVSLRPAGHEDYPAIFRWRSSTDVNLLNYGRRVASYEEFVLEIERLIQSSVFLVVRENKLGRPIGFVLGYNLNQWDGWAFVGAYVEEPYRLRGHGGEATLLGIDFAFRRFPLRMIYTEIYEFAQPLLRLCEATGFQQVGFQPEHFWHGDRFWGLYRMSLTRDAWTKHRDRFADIIDIQERFAQREESALGRNGERS